MRILTICGRLKTSGKKFNQKQIPFKLRNLSIKISLKFLPPKKCLKFLYDLFFRFELFFNDMKNVCLLPIWWLVFYSVFQPSISSFENRLKNNRIKKMMFSVYFLQMWGFLNKITMCLWYSGHIYVILHL